jgi:polygalacturonase
VCAFAPASGASPVTYSVTDFGARPNTSFISSGSFQQAIDQAASHATATKPGIVSVPGGTYTVANLRLRSNVWVEISNKATLRLGGSSVGENSAVFSMGTPGSTFLTNARIVGVGGSFTMDLSHSPNRYVNGIQVRNVKNFQIANMVAIQNDSNQRGAPSTYGGVITFHSVPGSKSGGPYYDPQGGTITNITTQHAPYAWGPIVLESGTNLKFSNITSHGGTPLKIETDQSIPGRVTSITASGIHCMNGHSGVMLTPHSQKNSGVHVTNVTANACESGLRLGQSTGGSFTSSSISGVSVTAGSGAQLRDSSGGTTSGWWKMGRSQMCMSKDSTVHWSIGITSLHCSGV